MRYEIKPGVRLVGVLPQTVLAMGIANNVYFEAGYDFVITSVVEGVHSRASIHYSGGAFDCRMRHVPNDQRQAIKGQIRSALGDDYDVILESGNSPHLHVEYQPKKPY